MEKRNGLPEKCCQQTTRDLFPLTFRPSCQAIRSDAQYHARNMARRLRSPLGISSAPPSPCFAEPVMPGSRFARLVTNMAFALMLAAPAGAFAQTPSNLPPRSKSAFLTGNLPRNLPHDPLTRLRRLRKNRRLRRPSSPKRSARGRGWSLCRAHSSTPAPR